MWIISGRGDARDWVMRYVRQGLTMPCENRGMSSSETREQYARAIEVAAKIESGNLVRALATVPREDYLGPGPWRILPPPAAGQVRAAIREVSDPDELYAD